MKMPPKFQALLLLCGCLPFAAISRVYAAAGSSASVTVTHGWTTVTAKPDAVAQGFFTLHNEGMTPDILTSVTCTVARETLIQNAQDHNVLQLPIKAGQTIELKPAGLHLVLEHPRFQFYLHAEIPCSAVFDHAGTMIVYLYVQAASTTSYRASSTPRSEHP